MLADPLQNIDQISVGVHPLKLARHQKALDYTHPLRA